MLYYTAGGSTFGGLDLRFLAAWFRFEVDASGVQSFRV